MPQFFVPDAHSSEVAEEAYARFVRNSTSGYPLAHPTARLFSISFSRVGRSGRTDTCVAEVGEQITNWAEPAGPVWAIVETTDLILVYTLYRGGTAGEPIMVGPEKVRGRVYFDDYPLT